MMAERKVYKTRLCVLYKKGHCHRQTCSFAHGDAELRRYNSSSSFTGRRDYRSGDLRDKLGRRRSPPRRNSLDRDARVRHPSRGHSSPRLGKRSDWNNRKRQRFDGESDYSGSLRTSDGAEDHGKDKKSISSVPKDVHDEQYVQLKQLQSEINMLEDHKHELEIYLQEKSQEADSLNSKIQELEMQLSTEKEECRRISSKIRKFVKAHNRHSRIQDELKRSQARLQKLGDQLGLDARAAVNEEDISIDILSDEETLGLNPPNKQHKNASPTKKRFRVNMVETDEESKQANSRKGERLHMGKMRSERHSRWDAHLASSIDNKEIGTDANGNSSGRHFMNESKPRRGKSISTSITSVDKLKDSELGLVLPTTGMAVHAVDEVVEVVESDEKFEAEATTGIRDEKGVAHDITGLTLQLPPPPPPVLQNAYSQHKGKDEDVDVDGLDDEMLDVDID